jgi:hypothetical protein
LIVALKAEFGTLFICVRQRFGLTLQKFCKFSPHLTE